MNTANPVMNQQQQQQPNGQQQAYPSQYHMAPSQAQPAHGEFCFIFIFIS
jgi:hypothetical protein